MAKADTADIRQVTRRLEAAGQQHVLKFWGDLSGESRAKLMEQIEALDLDALPGLVNEYVKNKPAAGLPGKIDPAPYFPYDPLSKVKHWDKASYKAAGESLLRRGKIAAFTVAGGQGSRLGF